MSMLREARLQIGLSQEKAAVMLCTTARTLAKYEKNIIDPPPDFIVRASRLYKKPLTFYYCMNLCPIGREGGTPCELYRRANEKTARTS